MQTMSLKRTFATNAGLTTDIKGGQAGVVVYQSSTNNTAICSRSNWSSSFVKPCGAPTWISFQQINVAITPMVQGMATDIKGGSLVDS